MPAKRRKIPARRIDGPSEAEWRLLIDQAPDPNAGPADLYLRTEGELRELWERNRELVLEYWVEEYPGTRPSLWWDYDAPRLPPGTLMVHGRPWPHALPEPRRRLGGTGTPCYAVLSYWPQFSKGIPTSWIEPWMVEYYNGRAKDIHGKPIDYGPYRYRDGDFVADAYDPKDPPRFETELAYLRRHRLLLPGEAARSP